MVVGVRAVGCFGDEGLPKASASALEFQGLDRQLSCFTGRGESASPAARQAPVARRQAPVGQ